MGWYGNNSNGRTQPAGRLKANALGLYDMTGNVWEWCWDLKAKYTENSPPDYVGPNEGNSRVLRGGSWLVNDIFARASDRYVNYPGYRG